MSKFYALQMATEVVKHHNIAETNGFLGHFKHAFYRPTNSMVESYCNYYNEPEARKIQSLIDSTDEQLDEHLSALSETNCVSSASFRLDMCVSQDCRFIAMQLNHVAGDVVTHLTSIRYFEDETALKVNEIFE